MQLYEDLRDCMILGADFEGYERLGHLRPLSQSQLGTTLTKG